MAQQKKKYKYKLSPETRAAWEENQIAFRFRLPRELAEQLLVRARSEAMTLTGWIRQACKKELRRKAA
jgi:hypothetical protein